MGVLSCEPESNVHGAIAAVLAMMLTERSRYPAKPLEPANSKAEFRSQAFGALENVVERPLAEPR